MKTLKMIFFVIAVIMLTGIMAMLPVNSFAAISSTDEKRTIEDGIYVIRSAIDQNFVIDVLGASTENEANIQLYEYSDVPQKKYKVTYLNNGYYSIIATHSNKSMDVKDASTQKGANVQQCEQNGTDAQKWIIKNVGNGYYSIISKCNGLYVDVYNAIAQNFQNIQMCDGNGLDAQKFKFEKVGEDNKPEETPEIVVPVGKKTIEDGTYVIRSAINTNFVIDVLGASKENGANIQLYEYSDAPQKKFKVTYLNNGYYSIIATHSNKSIDVKDASTQKGANVQQCEQNKEDAQKWVIKDVGNGYYSIISKCNGLYVDVYNAIAQNFQNIQMCDGNGLNAQKFKFEKVSTEPVKDPESEIKVPAGKQTIKDGTYIICSAINNNYVLDVTAASQYNGANIQLYSKAGVKQQSFKVTYLEDGYYSIIAVHSNKSIDVKDASKKIGANVQQWEANGTDAQKWVIKDVGNGYYSIISKCNGLYVDVYNAVAANGTNIQMCNSNGLNAQKFTFKEVVSSINIDTKKYPGYKEKIEALMKEHPNWNFKLLYTGIKFNDAVAGEYSVRKRNLVPTEYGGEWISGTTLYDTGWYGASEKAIAYYMDPRNFLDDNNIFQFQDVNQYIDNVCTLQGIKTKIANSFIADYAEDINTACLNKNVNPYYIIARLFQENGTNPKNGTCKMDAGNGKYYYNPFNIGATGDSREEVYNNAFARAKKEGWDTMVKALEGGINFCKKNWLDNYQNTLYQNKFDIDSTNGSSLYTHQYMQNLLGAYNEAKILRSSYTNTGKLESNFTFQIPVYEEMDEKLSPMPVNNQESYAINVKTTGTSIYIRSDANADSNDNIIGTIKDKGTILLSIKRGINSKWQQIVTAEGLIGYISGDYLEQIDDITTCNYKAKVKTHDGDGCNVRLGPSTRTDKLTAITDGTEVTVIDDSTYKNIDGYNWSRVILPNRIQAFIPNEYLTK